MRTGKVDLEKTVKEADADAKAVSANIIEGLKTKQKSTVEKE
ncbi:hypothetical protein EC2850750_5216 [Escherichia coli 2850750]|nr:hypothetical protein EC2850750_5216 [Escherichia coli 2850750]